MPLEDVEIERRLSVIEQRSKSNTHRLDVVEQKNEEIHEIALAVRELATEMRQMKSSQNELNERITAREKRPAARLNSITTAIISALAGAGTSFFISAINF